MAGALPPCFLSLCSSPGQHTQHGSGHPGHTQHTPPTPPPTPIPHTGLPTKTDPIHRQQWNFYWWFLRNVKGKLPSRTRVPEKSDFPFPASFLEAAFPRPQLQVSSPPQPLLSLLTKPHSAGSRHTPAPRAVSRTGYVVCRAWWRMKT